MSMQMEKATGFCKVRHLVCHKRLLACQKCIPLRPKALPLAGKKIGEKVFYIFASQTCLALPSPCQKCAPLFSLVALTFLWFNGSCILFLSIDMSIVNMPRIVAPRFQRRRLVRRDALRGKQGQKGMLMLPFNHSFSGKAWVASAIAFSSCGV